MVTQQVCWEKEQRSGLLSWPMITPTACSCLTTTVEKCPRNKLLVSNDYPHGLFVFDDDSGEMPTKQIIGEKRVYCEA